MKRRERWSVAALGVLCAATTFGTGNAAATEPLAPDAVDDDVVIVETFTLGGELLSRKAFGDGNNPVPVPGDFVHQGPSGAAPSTIAAITASEQSTGGSVSALGSGDGGTSSASGCLTVTVQNEKETYLGFTGYWYDTWTNWCWNRAGYNVYSVSTNWNTRDVDPNYYWRGQHNLVQGHYSYVGGQTTSGYEHERTGTFENCVLHYGCVGILYPRNNLYSHHDGTWHWSTGG